MRVGAFIDVHGAPTLTPAPLPVGEGYAVPPFGGKEEFQALAFASRLSNACLRDTPQR